jgi:hypothetical protein
MAVVYPAQIAKIIALYACSNTNSDNGLEDSDWYCKRMVRGPEKRLSNNTSSGRRGGRGRLFLWGGSSLLWLLPIYHQLQCHEERLKKAQQVQLSQALPGTLVLTIEDSRCRHLNTVYVIRHHHTSGPLAPRFVPGSARRCPWVLSIYRALPRHPRPCRQCRGGPTKHRQQIL